VQTWSLETCPGHPWSNISRCWASPLLAWCVPSVGMAIRDTMQHVVPEYGIRDVGCLELMVCGVITMLEFASATLATSPTFNLPRMASESLISLAVLPSHAQACRRLYPHPATPLRSRLQQPSHAPCRSNGDPHPWHHLTMFLSKSRIVSHRAAGFIVRLVYRNRLSCIDPSCFYLRHAPLSLRLTDRCRNWVQARMSLSLNVGPCHCPIYTFDMSISISRSLC
jgi:hypothetical protein